jgi:hypothetical protein
LNETTYLNGKAPAPTEQALQLLLRAIVASVIKRLVRQGIWVQEQDECYVADGVAQDTDASALRPLQQGSIVYRIAFDPSTALANARVKINAKGQVELKLKTRLGWGLFSRSKRSMEAVKRLLKLLSPDADYCLMF